MRVQAHARREGPFVGGCAWVRGEYVPAEQAQVPLVPIALQTDFAGLGRWIKDFGPVDPGRPVRFAAGAPIPAGTPSRAMQQQCVACIGEKLAAWGLAPVLPAASA